MDREERLCILETVKKDTIEKSYDTESPIAEIIITEIEVEDNAGTEVNDHLEESAGIANENNQSRSYIVTFYFERVEELMNLGEKNLKDQFMGYFIQGLVNTGYPLGKHPHIQFQIDIRT